ncbi:MAG: MarR family winged helix-turn-helix transcriptional regulator [Pseudomonadota bacterium]
MTDLPDFDLDRFTPYRLAVVAQKTSEGLARLYRDRFGISIPEWRVLAHLAHSGDVSVRDIEARVVMEKSKVSRAAARLEAAGYLQKTADKSDRRLVSMSLTAKGNTLMSELLPLAMEYQRRLEDRLGAAFDDFEAGVDRLLSDGKVP